ncbi:MAG: TIGR04076 family protein [Desulfatiglandales bacterium]
MGRLIITVKEIKGNCPVYGVGNRIVLDEGYRMNLKETHNVCMHSLSSIMPYYIALFRGVKPRDLGLSRGGEKAYIQCLDPCKYTGGGTVIFEIEKQG